MHSGVQPRQASSPVRAPAKRSKDRYLLVVAASSGFAGVWLAAHYPIEPAATAAAFVVACIVFWANSGAWLVVVPAVLPLIGFAPWTGWITFEELDLLVLAVATGGYVRLAVTRWRE